MISTRRYNRNHSKRLRENCSRAGKESQRVQALKRQAMAEQGWNTLEDIIERHKRDRKGLHYATWKREGVTMELRYSLNRSDQFDVTMNGVETRNLSLPKALKRFANGK